MKMGDYKSPIFIQNEYVIDMDVLCNFLFVEETSKDHRITLHPIVIKFGGKHRSIKLLCTPRIEYAATLPIQHLSVGSKQNGNFVIVGAGPTIYEFTSELDSLRDNTDNTICSINKAHEFLIKRNIVPDIHIFYEKDISSVEQSLGGPPHKDVTYYVCSTCDEYLFKQLKHYKCILWHTEMPSDPDGGYNQLISSLFPNEPIIGVGLTSFPKLFGIGRILGFNRYELYGIDCSFPIVGTGYIDEYKEIYPEPRLYVWARNNLGELRKYNTNVTLMVQATEFVKYCKENKGLDVKVHGEGLLGFVVKDDKSS